MRVTFRKIRTMRVEIRQFREMPEYRHNRQNRNSSPLGPWSVLAPRAPPDYSEAPRAAYNATRGLNPRRGDLVGEDIRELPISPHAAPGPFWLSRAPANCLEI